LGDVNRTRPQRREQWAPAQDRLGWRVGAGRHGDGSPPHYCNEITPLKRLGFSVAEYMVINRPDEPAPFTLAAGATRRRPRGARRLSARRTDRPHRGQRASPQAPLRREAQAYAGAIRQVGGGRDGILRPAIAATSCRGFTAVRRLTAGNKARKTRKCL